MKKWQLPWILVCLLVYQPLSATAESQAYRNTKAFQAYTQLELMYRQARHDNPRYDNQFKPYLMITDDLQAILDLFPEQDQHELWLQYYMSTTKYKAVCREADEKSTALMKYISNVLKEPNTQVTISEKETMTLYSIKELISFKATLREVKANFRACYKLGR